MLNYVKLNSCSRKEGRWASKRGWSLIHWFWNQIYTVCHNTSCATWKLFLSFVTCATSSVWFFSNILWSASQAKPTTSGLASIPLITWLMQSVTWAMLRTQICNWRIFWQSIIPTLCSRPNTLWLQYFYVDLSNNPSLSNKLLPPPYEISGSSITGRNFSSARILRRTSPQSWTVSTQSLNCFTDDCQIQFQLPAILPGFTWTIWYDFSVPNRDFFREMIFHP